MSLVVERVRPRGSSSKPLASEGAVRSGLAEAESADSLMEAMVEVDRLEGTLDATLLSGTADVRAEVRAALATEFTEC